MPQPYNYSLNIPDPSQALVNGLQIRSAIQQQKAGEAQQAQAQQMQSELSALAEKPTTAGISSMMIKYPSLATPLQKALESVSEEQKQSRISQASGVYSAMLAGQPEIAKGELTKQAEAARNAGDENSAKAAETLAQMVDVAPESAKLMAGMFLSSSMGADKFAETFTKLEQERRDTAAAPAELSKKQSEAAKAAVAAKYAESDAVLDLQKKGWDISKLQNDIAISRENVRIAAINAEMQKESNDIERQSLQQKLDDAQRKRDETLREKSAAAESAAASIDNLLNTADKVINTPAGVVSDATGTISSKLPTVDQDVADFEETVETMKSQAFMAQIPGMKGSGALSEAEGKKLEASLQNLSLRQSPEKLLGNVREIQRLMLKARSTLAAKYGMPESTPDRPNVQTTPESRTSEIPVPDTGGFRVINVRRQ